MKNECVCGGNCHCKRHKENTKMIDYFWWFFGGCMLIAFVVDMLS